MWTLVVWLFLYCSLNNVQASRHQAHKNGTIFKVKVIEKYCIFLTKMKMMMTMMAAELRRINWKVFCPTWRIADWDFWENKQSKAWDEPKSHLAVMKVLYWSAKTQILGPFPCLERHSTGFLLVWDTSLPCLGISSVWPIHTLWRLNISLSSCSLQEEEYRDLVSISQSMEEQYGQYFDSVIPFEEVFVFSRYWNFYFLLVSSRPTAGADFEEMPNKFANMLSTCFQSPVLG